MPAAEIQFHDNVLVLSGDCSAAKRIPTRRRS